MDHTVAKRPPRVFVSYSHDSEQHADRVLALANRLRRDGIDCCLDQYEPHPPEGWPLWMERQVEQADFVLVVCTESYSRRDIGREKPGVGRGVRFESVLIRDDLYDAAMWNEKFIPVFFGSAAEQYVIKPLRGVARYDLQSDEGYIRLHKRLTNTPDVFKPPLGTLVSHPPKSPGLGGCSTVKIDASIEQSHLEASALGEEPEDARLSAHKPVADTSTRRNQPTGAVPSPTLEHAIGSLSDDELRLVVDVSLKMAPQVIQGRQAASVSVNLGLHRQAHVILNTQAFLQRGLVVGLSSSLEIWEGHESQVLRLRKQEQKGVNLEVAWERLIAEQQGLARTAREEVVMKLRVFLVSLEIT